MSTSALYRNLVRQLNLNSLQKTKTSASREELKQIVKKAADLEPKEREQFESLLSDLTLYFKSHRQHKELLERYNPTHNLTQDERARMSARRVGLQFPEEVTEKKE